MMIMWIGIIWIVWECSILEFFQKPPGRSWLTARRLISSVCVLGEEPPGGTLPTARSPGDAWLMPQFLQFCFDCLVVMNFRQATRTSLAWFSWFGTLGRFWAWEKNGYSIKGCLLVELSSNFMVWATYMNETMFWMGLVENFDTHWIRVVLVRENFEWNKWENDIGTGFAINGVDELWENRKLVQYPKFA